MTQFLILFGGFSFVSCVLCVFACMRSAQISAEENTMD